MVPDEFSYAEESIVLFGQYIARDEKLHLPAVYSFDKLQAKSSLSWCFSFNFTQFAV